MIFKNTSATIIEQFSNTGRAKKLESHKLLMVHDKKSMIDKLFTNVVFEGRCWNENVMSKFSDSKHKTH